MASVDSRASGLHGPLTERSTTLEGSADVLREIIPAGHHCGPVNVDPDQFARLEAAFARDDAAQAARMPTVQDALRQVSDAISRLEKLGWRNAIYCPKDGSPFEVVTMGSVGVFRCTYSGEWPDGLYMIEDGGDLWPTRNGVMMFHPMTGHDASGSAHKASPQGNSGRPK